VPRFVRLTGPRRTCQEVPLLKLGSKVGHILVTEFLAKGGMGDVYAGHDERLGRRVALKAIRAEHRLDGQVSFDTTLTSA